MTDKMYKYFPYRPRDGQKIIVPNTYRFLRNDDHNGMIQSAASGLGKEVCFTSQALLALEDNLFDRVIFTIPTDSGKENILKELGSVNHGKKVIKVFSKEILCNWMKETEDERISAIEEEGCAFYLCKLQEHRCIYKNNGCQYELQKEGIKDADILICDYNYIISPFIRRFSGFEEILQDNRTLLLINECHMLKKRAEMIFSNSISSTTINRAIKELDRYGYKEEKYFVEGIIRSMAKEVTRHYKILKSRMEKNYEGVGEVILQSSDIQKFLGVDSVEEIERVGEILISVGEEISKIKFERKEGLISYTEAIGNFISRFVRLINYNKDSAVFFLKLKERQKSKDETYETSYIGWTPLDVRGFLRNAIKNADKYILYSGTIKPSRLRNDVGLAYEKVYIPEPIESPYLINRKDIILAKERFYHKNLKDESFSKRIIKDLDKLFPNIPKPIGIVCTNQWYTNLNLSSKYDILNEPDTQEEIGDWLKIHVPKAELIRFTPFGRVAQSVDISLKSIIFLGFPYEKYDSIMEEKISKTAKTFKGKAGNSTAKATYIHMIEPAYERIIQSVMRGLRNENDRLNVIYYDVNFKLNKPALGSKNLVVCNTISEVISHIQNN
ncbi:MAG: hypothetical protein Q8N79_06005 [Candidatus Methanoperedens sp.]|nr:hypothetical protein [Candidatus Methanoperedens sp.]